MHSLIDWLKAGSPAHYLWLVGAAILIVEDMIARSRLASNSTIQLVSQLLAMIPGLGKVLGVLAPKGPPDVLRILLIIGLGGMVLAGSGCAQTQLAQAHLGLSTLAQICDAGDKAVTAYDVQLDAEVVAQAQANGDVSAARKRLGDWHVARAKARAIERECLAGVLGYQVALQTYEAKKAGSFDFIAFAQGLSRMAMELVEGLRALGVNVPSLPKFSTRDARPGNSAAFIAYSNGVTLAPVAALAVFPVGGAQ